MCIGIPMQVEAVESGHAWVVGRGERRRVETALVAPVRAGDWLLVFLGGARARIGARRAAEVDAALDLLVDALGGTASAADPGFALPSAMSPAELAVLAGGSPVTAPEPDASLRKE
jgi:hydrogenase expression/formation protein HypC